MAPARRAEELNATTLSTPLKGAAETIFREPRRGRRAVPGLDGRSPKVYVERDRGVWNRIGLGGYGLAGRTRMGTGAGAVARRQDL